MFRAVKELLLRRLPHEKSPDILKLLQQFIIETIGLFNF